MGSPGAYAEANMITEKSLNCNGSGKIFTQEQIELTSQILRNPLFVRPDGQFQSFSVWALDIGKLAGKTDGGLDELQAVLADLL